MYLAWAGRGGTALCLSGGNGRGRKLAPAGQGALCGGEKQQHGLAGQHVASCSMLHCAQHMRIRAVISFRHQTLHCWLANIWCSASAGAAAVSCAFQGMKHADFIIEAVVENEGVKRSIFQELDKVCVCM